MTDKTITCPKCGGEADNGQDREFPPNAYVCSKCDKPEAVTMRSRAELFADVERYTSHLPACPVETWHSEYCECGLATSLKKLHDAIAASTQQLAEKDALIAQLEKALKMIRQNDKTEYDYGNGAIAKNRNGKRPANGRWLTPKELADQALAAIQVHREGK